MFFYYIVWKHIPSLSLTNTIILSYPLHYQITFLVSKIGLSARMGNDWSQMEHILVNLITSSVVRDTYSPILMYVWIYLCVSIFESDIPQCSSKTFSLLCVFKDTHVPTRRFPIGCVLYDHVRGEKWKAMHWLLAIFLPEGIPAPHAHICYTQGV